MRRLLHDGAAFWLGAGEKDNTAILDVRFGNLEGTLPAEPAKADKPAEKPAEPNKN